jgi:hypothetical protein
MGKRTQVFTRKVVVVSSLVNKSLSLGKAMPTLGEELLKKYHTLQKACEEKVGKFPLPKVGDVDAEDIFMIVLTYFRNHEERLPTLRKYASLKGFDLSDLDKIYPDIEEFLDWVNETIRRTDL